MAVVINSAGSDSFVLNGVTYNKIFQPLAVGSDEISIYNTFDTRFQLLAPTLYTEFTINSVVYGTQALTVAALLPLMYTSVPAGVTGAVDSFQTRTGDVIPLIGDYSGFYSLLGHTHTFAEITSKPTTLSGFGITDAYTKTQSDTNFYENGQKVADSELLDGFNSSVSSTISTIALRDPSGDIKARLFRSEYDVTNSNVNFIMTQIDTADNNFVRPTSPAQFRTAVTDAFYLGVNDTADNSQLLDSINSTQFLRSDTADSKTSGSLIFNDNIELQFGTSNDSNIFSSGSHSYWDLVVGNLYIRNNTTTKFTFDRTGGNLTATGNINAAGFFETSERKLKTNIQPYNAEAMDIINDISVVTFDRIDGSQVNKIGVIIDDSPSEIANTDHTAVDLYKTIFVCVKAIQELKDEIKKLKK